MQLIKRENASDFILILLISALLSLLITRFFLGLFGWPTISFGIWHIAHVIWGGTLMLVGIILTLTTYGEKVRKISAIVSGIGWGLFIDEVGKYITKDNNYWFQPAIIFIYISFIILFLIYWHYEKDKKQNSMTLLYSAINKLENIAEGDLDIKEQKAVIKKLDLIIRTEEDEDKKTFAKDLKTFVWKHPAKKEESKNFWFQLLSRTGYFSYNRIFKRKFVQNSLAIYAGAWAIYRIQETIRILANPQRMQLIKKFYDDYNFIGKTDVYMISLKIISDSIAAIFFLMGIFYLATKKRSEGLRFFQLGLIVSIFLSSVFKLYFEQFSESIIIASSVVLLYAITKLKREISA